MTNRDALGAALESYRPETAEEAADVARLRAAHATDDVFSRSAPLHVTGSALVVDPATERVLLRWHPIRAQWMQVGGHFDPGETDPLAVAHREAREETGLDDLTDLGGAGGALLQIVIVPVPAHGAEPAHEHADFRYLLVTDRPTAVRAESETATLRWVPFATAVAEVGEDNLRVFLARARAIVEAGPAQTEPD